MTRWLRRPNALLRALAGRTAVFTALAGGSAVPGYAQDVDAFRRLSSGEKRDVYRGKAVARTTPSGDGQLPDVDVFRFVYASHELCAAVFADVDEQQRFVPRVVFSRRLWPTGPNPARDSSIIDLRSIVDYPSPFPTDTLELRHRVARHGPDGFIVSWHLLTGAITESVDGFASCEAKVNPQTSARGTLLWYHQRAVPRKGTSARRIAESPIGPRVVRHALSESVDAFGKRAESLERAPTTSADRLRARQILAAALR